jgi:hypothetical protein
MLRSSKKTCGAAAIRSNFNEVAAVTPRKIRHHCYCIEHRASASMRPRQCLAEAKHGDRVDGGAAIVSQQGCRSKGFSIF